MSAFVNRTECAIQILSKTRDGDDLAPQHLSLLELVVNDRASEAGISAFDQLFEKVSAGTYQAPWFHDRINLTKDHVGYVYWRGEQVEHYTFRDVVAEGAAARRLADQCIKLEALGYVPGKTPSPERVVALAQDPRTLPWAHAIAKVGVYAILERAGVVDGVRQAVILFWGKNGTDPESTRMLCGVGIDTKNRVEVMVEPVRYGRPDGFGLDLFYQFQNDGYSCVGLQPDMLVNPQVFAAWADEFGFTAGGFGAIAEAASEYNQRRVERDADRFR